jgi:TadE-like protein
MSMPDDRPAKGEGAQPERGAVAVEFAILLPVLIVILFGITAFGLAFSRFETYISAAREGARYAAVHCQPDASSCTSALIVNRVQQAAVGYPIGPGSPTASIPGAASIDCGSYPGQPITVQWVQHIPIQIPLLPDLSKDVTIKGVFRCE